MVLRSRLCAVGSNRLRAEVSGYCVEDRGDQFDKRVKGAQRESGTGETC